MYELLSRMYESLSCTYESLSRMYESLSRTYESLSPSLLLAAKCPMGFQKLGGESSCYRVQSDSSPQTFEGARAYCRALDSHAHLATVSTPREREALARHLSTKTREPLSHTASYRAPLLKGWGGGVSRL